MHSTLLQNISTIAHMEKKTKWIENFKLGVKVLFGVNIVKMVKEAKSKSKTEVNSRENPFGK